MGKTFKVQPSEFVDHVTDDGRELKQLPRPYFVDEAGFVDRQNYWRGDPYQVIGFAKKPVAGRVDLLWDDATRNPLLATGMHLVTANADEDFYTHVNTISSVTLIKSDDA